MKQAKHLAEIYIFLEVAKHLSFVRAAERLQMDTAAVSKSIASLEKRLGTRLLQRTTRVVALTESGVIYAHKCKQIISAFDEAGDAVTKLHESPRGLLRVALPMTFAQMHICPLLPTFMEENHNVSLEVTMSDGMVDLISNDIDVAIRIGIPSDSRLASRQLALSKRLLCASESYLAQAGRPRHPTELQQHNCLIFSPRSSDHVWTFKRGQAEEKIPVSGTIRANNSIALLNAALAGVGITSLATHIIFDYVSDGRLDIVLPEWRQETIPIYAVYPSNRYTPLKVRTFVDFFVKHFAGKTALWTKSFSGRKGRGSIA